MLVAKSSSNRGRGAAVRILFAHALATFASACGDDTVERREEVDPPVDERPTYEARFEETPCWLPLSENQPADSARCGYLVVPQNRAVENGPEVSIAVAIFRSTSATPAPDPLLFLDGGPGANSLSETLPYLTDSFLEPLISRRPLIYFDPRGVGFSSPNLECPEFDEAFLNGLGAMGTTEENAAVLATAMMRCRDRWTAAGIDLENFTSATTAADVVDLMKVLGFTDYNLVGFSYGTRVALTILRDAPAGVRSVVLDSTVPVQVDDLAEATPNLESALSSFFLACSDSEQCNEDHPDLERRFYEFVASLDADPFVFSFTERDSDVEYDVHLDSELFIRGVEGVLGDSRRIASIPTLLELLMARNPTLLPPLGQGIADSARSRSDGVYFGTRCREEVPFTTSATVEAAVQNTRPELASLSRGLHAENQAICSALALAPLAPNENVAVASDVPALFLVGELDPATPPSWSELAAASFAVATVASLRGFGHGVLYESRDCAMQLAAQFVEQPTVPVALDCLAELPGPF